MDRKRAEEGQGQAYISLLKLLLLLIFLNGNYNYMNNIDWKFIEIEEGNKTEGYVPKNKDGTAIGKSGVTVGMGFDLGGKNIADLKGLPDSLVDLLKPYLGLKGAKAQQKLNEQSLSLDTDQLKRVNSFVKKKYYNEVKDYWNANVPEEGPVKNFKDLPKHLATIVYSTGHQYGTNFTDSAPKFIGKALEGKWFSKDDKDKDSVDYILKNFEVEDILQKRKTIESNYLKHNKNWDYENREPLVFKERRREVAKQVTEAEKVKSMIARHARLKEIESMLQGQPDAPIPKPIPKPKPMFPFLVHREEPLFGFTPIQNQPELFGNVDPSFNETMALLFNMLEKENKGM